MTKTNTTGADARNAAIATSESYRKLTAALNGDRREHGPDAGRIRRRLSRATAAMEREAAEELASAFVTAGASQFSEALASAAFYALGGRRGRAALDALPGALSQARSNPEPEIVVIAEPSKAKIRRQGVTVPMLMAVAADQVHRDAVSFRFTAAKAGNAIREGIRTLAAQKLLERAATATRKYVVGIPKRVLPLAVGLSLVGAAAVGQEIRLTGWEGVSAPTSNYTSVWKIKAQGADAPDVADWNFPITVKASQMGFVGAESDVSGAPTNAFLDLAHKALSITLKDDVIAANQIQRAVGAMETCMVRDQICRVETLGLSLDPGNKHHTIRLLPSAGYSLESEALAFDFQGTYHLQSEVAEYVERTYEVMFGPSVDNAPSY